MLPIFYVVKSFGFFLGMWRDRQELSKLLAPHITGMGWFVSRIALACNV